MDGGWKEEGRNVLERKKGRPLPRTLRSPMAVCRAQHGLCGKQNNKMKTHRPRGFGVESSSLSEQLCGVPEPKGNQGGGEVGSREIQEGFL